jgi:hypothetical protein
VNVTIFNWFQQDTLCGLMALLAMRSYPSNSSSNMVFHWCDKHRIWTSELLACL